MRNVFACLVHEREECVVDLVRNLTHMDPDSAILLYNGGSDADLLRRRFAFAGPEPLIHPRPKPQRYGRLHGFALDCLRYAAETAEWDVITFVDSDQLLVRPGYSTELTSFLESHAEAGMLGSSTGRQPLTTPIYPAAQAWAELELWRPVLRTFPGGEECFPSWTFWPGTVVTAAAARQLVELIDSHALVSDILQRTGIFATEEVVLPTLVSLLGFDIALSIWSYDYVGYRKSYGHRELGAALRRQDIYWIHPVKRRYGDSLRSAIRNCCGHYSHGSIPVRSRASVPIRSRCLQPLRSAPILAEMRVTEGWLDDDEAGLLIAAAARALTLPGQPALVEAGAFCGRSTVVLAMTAEAVGNGVVWSIDPHDGVVGAPVERRGPTRGKLERNLERAGVRELVTIVESEPHRAQWARPVSLLVVDGLHDYPSASRDFARFEPWLVEGALVAFHDYADYFPGVQALVHELLASGRYEEVGRAGTMVVLMRIPRGSTQVQLALDANAPVRRSRTSRRADVPGVHASGDGPLVSCLLPTYERPAWVLQAVAYFLRQTYSRAELIILDDGRELLADVLPNDPRIRYVRLGRRYTIGAKRNLGCELSRGDLIAHWDDDDWSAPWRLAYQVEALKRERADVCGLSRLHHFELESGRAWLYAFPSDARPWVSDGTLLYTRDFWRGNHFMDSSRAIDCQFLWTDRPKRLYSLPDERFYVAMIHARNTSPKDTRDPLWRPEPRAVVETLLGSDICFYHQVGG